MSWAEKKEPKYEIELFIEGIELTIQYDVANMSPDLDYWDEVNSSSEIYVKRIIHKDVDIKRMVRGYPKTLITDMIYGKHNS